MLSRILPILIAYGAAAMTPGAAVIVVARTSLASGRSQGALTALGVASGTTIYAAASLFGLSALALTVPVVLHALQLGGAAYLGWLGVRLVVLKPGLSLEGQGGERSSNAFGRGLLTNLSNPHAVVFFVGVFGTMLEPSVSAHERLVVLLAVSCMSVIWYSTVAIALSSARAQAAYQRLARTIDVLAGCVMIYFAFRFMLAALK